MERRQFIRGFCSGVVTWPLAAYAQQVSNPRRIGVLGADPIVWSSWTAAFVTRLRELGWTTGETVDVDYRWARGKLQACERFHGRIRATKRRRNRHIWKRRSCGTAGDNDHSYSLSCGVRSWFWFGCKFGPAGRQRYWNVSPTVRACWQAA